MGRLGVGTGRKGGRGEGLGEGTEGKRKVFYWALAGLESKRDKILTSIESPDIRRAGSGEPEPGKNGKHKTNGSSDCGNKTLFLLLFPTY